MCTRTSKIAIFLSVLFLNACAGTTPPHEALPPIAQEHITSTEVIFPIRQSEIYVSVPNSNVVAATGGGLLGALIDAGINDVRTSKAEAAVKRLRDALVDYNFDSRMEADAKGTLERNPWLHAVDYRVLRDTTTSATDGALTDSNDNAVLFVTVDYRLSNDGDVLDISARSGLYPKDPALMAIKPFKNSGPKTTVSNALYHNAFLFEAILPGATSDRDHNIAILSANSGAEMRALLDKGAGLLAEMVAADLEGADMPDSTAAAITIKGFKGKVVSKNQEGQLIRFDDGTMMYQQPAAIPH